MHESSDRSEVVLEVEDNGVGFELEKPVEPGGGLGLIGMEERAQISGGRLEFETHPGAGTKVRMWIPVKAEARTPGAGDAGES